MLILSSPLHIHPYPCMYVNTNLYIREHGLLLRCSVIAQLSQCTGARGGIDDPPRPRSGPPRPDHNCDCALSPRRLSAP